MQDNEWTTRHFRYDHLPENLQKISKIFAEAAAQIMLLLPRSPERSAALHDLLRSKDSAVRGAIPNE